MGGERLRHPFLVVANVQKALILGSDFLVLHGAKIDLDAMKMTLRDGGPTVELHLTRGDRHSPRLPVVETRPTIAAVSQDNRRHPEVNPAIPLRNRFAPLESRADRESSYTPDGNRTNHERRIQTPRPQRRWRPRNATPDPHQHRHDAYRTWRTPDTMRQRRQNFNHERPDMRDRYHRAERDRRESQRHRYRPSWIQRRWRPYSARSRSPEQPYRRVTMRSRRTGDPRNDWNTEGRMRNATSRYSNAGRHLMVELAVPNPQAYAEHKRERWRPRRNDWNHNYHEDTHRHEPRRRSDRDRTTTRYSRTTRRSTSNESDDTTTEDDTPERYGLVTRSTNNQQRKRPRRIRRKRKNPKERSHNDAHNAYNARRTRAQENIVVSEPARTNGKRNTTRPSPRFLRRGGGIYNAYKRSGQLRQHGVHTTNGWTLRQHR